MRCVYRLGKQLNEGTALFSLQLRGSILKMSVPMKWRDYPSPLVTLFDISE